MSTCIASGSVLDMPRRESPDIPDDLRDTWEELLRVTEARRRAEEDLTKRSAEARELVVKLLREGVATGRMRRQDLVDKPFSSAGLTQIQQAEGLINRPRK